MIEKKRGLKRKKLIETGLPYFDFFKNQMKKHNQECDSILIASSWGEKGLLKNYGYKILDLIKDFKVIIRPHPQSLISEKDFINKFKYKCSKYSNIFWDESRDPTLSFSKSYVVISDTSSIRFDYSFLTSRPVITLDIDESKLLEYELSIIGKSWSKEIERKLDLY